MKIKCPFCKTIYDPEACDNTCPACNKKLMVSVFKKKPEIKPGAGPATVRQPLPAPAPASPVAPPPPPSTPTPPPPPPPPPPEEPAAHPVTEFVAPRAPIIASPIRTPSHTSAKTQIVTEAHIVQPPNKVVVAAPAPAPEHVPPPPPATRAMTVEKKTEHHGNAKPSMDLVISLQQGAAEDWGAVIRIPVQVFKLANLIPARAREAIESEGIDFDELRKAVEHTDHSGPLLDIQTQTQHVHIAIEPHH